VQVKVVDDPVNVKPTTPVKVSECRLSGDLEGLLDREELCDVTICVGDRELHAHKALLAGQCAQYVPHACLLRIVVATAFMSTSRKCRPPGEFFFERKAVLSIIIRVQNQTEISLLIFSFNFRLLSVFTSDR